MPPKIEVSLKRQLKLREVYLEFFNSADKFVKKGLDNASVTELKWYNKFLDDYYRDFLKVQTEIESLDESEIDGNLRVTMDRKFFNLKPTIENKLLEIDEAKKAAINGSSQMVTSVEELAFTPKLPDLTIEIFYGAPEKWQVFIESFNNHIHNNKRLTSMTKFQYLRNLTKGEGAKPIESVEFTADNYEEARKLLIERFDKPNQIAEHHIRCLFNLKKIEKPTSSNILHLLDEFNSHTRSLKSLGRPVQFWDDLLVYLMVTKLDSESKSKWRDFSSVDRLPTYDDMCNFLKSRSHKLQDFKTDNHNSPAFQLKSTSNSAKSNRQRLSFHVTKSFHCVYCNSDGHSIMKCRQFIDLAIPERRSTVEKLKICFNCLKPSHFATKCPSTDTCRICKTKHHTLLHLDHTTITQPSQSTSSLSSAIVHTNSATQLPHSTTNISNALSSTSSRNANYVLLATAIVEVIDKFGSPIQARALLDSGSQINFITEGLASRLGIKTFDSILNVHGIACSSAVSSRSASVHLRSRLSNFSTIIDVQILAKITNNQPSLHIDTSNWMIPINIKLADPQFFEPHKIDILLGADTYYELQSVGQVKLGKSLPFLQNTQLGWVVSGRTELLPSTTTGTCNIVSNCISTETVHRLLEKFWETDEGTSNHDPIFNSECDKHFLTTHSRDSSGRFIVRLPFSPSVNELGNSSIMAQKRFFSLERRLLKMPDLLQQYNDFMAEYVTLGHMKLESEINPCNYYLPHHCIIKPDSSSTRLRVVFDGSAKTTSGASLNDTLMVGPTVQNELFAVLIRFRNAAYAFSADITKMYRQIRVHEHDQSYQYILWRFNPMEPLRTYKLQTVTYGTSSAPYLATRCLLQLSLKNQSEFPAASNAIRYDFYVDDMLSGANSIDDAIAIKSTITDILEGAGMPLRKWCANDPAILHDVPESDREQLIPIDEGEFVKTLGLLWNSKVDRFQLKVTTSANPTKVTKRIVISEIAKIFDPMGLVSPIVVFGKLFMQRLWQLQVNWDESLPMQYHTHWLNFRNELPKLNDFSIPRHLFNRCQNPRNIQLHGFADASEKAFGAVIYVRCEIQEEICVRLLCSRSRVAPLKKTTLPRLELCAAQLLATLIAKVCPIINFNVTGIYAWSDSTIVLHWIQSPSSRWKTYVANRISDIQSHKQINYWHHIESKLNPADVISRGCLPDDLSCSHLWWNGPSFLRDFNEFWQTPSKIMTYKLQDENQEERKMGDALIVHKIHPSADLLQRLLNVTSTYPKLIRLASYIAQYARQVVIKSAHSSKCKSQSSDEHQSYGTNLIIRLVQRECFPELYDGLQNPKFIVRDPRVKSLSLFMDTDKIIKIGGRLQFSTLSYTSKHPALLPSSHTFTNMLVNFFHRKYLHIGPQGLLSIIRQQFWPINGLELVKRICRHCLLCSRVRPRLLRQQMAALPTERVSIAPPFYNVGVDYAGPFYIHYRARGRVPTKTFLSIFVCFVTKAVHLELASDLSSASFIGCFRRFIATRGLCKNVFSDNGTNFVGANSNLHELYVLLQGSELKDDFNAAFHDDKIIWHFMPAGSPHFGGLYEAAVKSAKYHLRRTMGTATLTYEELNTLIKQVEAVLNSRPLTSLPSDNEFEVLTPGHFLIGRPLVAIPESNLPEDRNLNFAKHWELVNQIYKSFWSRWSNEYLQQLQHRYYWQNKQRNISLGTIVLIKDENQPPLRWKIGRIITLHPGADGLVRVVTLKTATGKIQRGIDKLSPLPISVEPHMVQGGENENDQQFLSQQKSN